MRSAARPLPSITTTETWRRTINEKGSKRSKDEQVVLLSRILGRFELYLFHLRRPRKQPEYSVFQHDLERVTSTRSSSPRKANNVTMERDFLLGKIFFKTFAKNDFASIFAHCSIVDQQKAIVWTVQCCTVVLGDNGCWMIGDRLLENQCNQHGSAEMEWRWLTFCPFNCSRPWITPHGAMPTTTIFERIFDRIKSASPTCLTTPVLIPEVNIHAPAVFAAFSNPRLSTWRSRGCNSKFWIPPWILTIYRQRISFVFLMPSSFVSLPDLVTVSATVW